MSETPFPNDGSSGGEIVDRTVQRKWDQFAKPDHSDAPEPPGSPRALHPHNSANATVVTRASNPLLAGGSTTALDDTVSTADANDPVEEDADDVEGHGAR